MSDNPVPFEYPSPSRTAILDEFYPEFICDHPTHVYANVKLLDPLAKLPEYAHDTDSCFDLFSIENHELEPGDVRRIRTGVSIQLQSYLDMQFESKSGMANKGIIVVGGAVDSGYTGEMGVTLANIGWERYVVGIGDKITQVRIQPRYRAHFTVVEELEIRDRGDNGYGSTGLKARTQ